jgi:hypothetical protein
LGKEKQKNKQNTFSKKTLELLLFSENLGILYIANNGLLVPQISFISKLALVKQFTNCAESTKFQALWI